MKLIIFGATGTIGVHLIEQALEQYHVVTAYVRNPDKMSINHANLNVIRGNVLDPASVKAAIQGHDAVICALGAGRKGKIRSEGSRNIIHAMEDSGIRRLICLSTLGAGDSRESLNFFWKYIMFGLLLRKAYADHQMQEELVQQSRLDWTIVRPGAFTDGEHTKTYRHGFSPSDKTIRLKISRADVADFMLNQLKDAQYLHQAPGISY